MEIKPNILSPLLTLCIAVVTWCQSIDVDYCLGAGFTKDLICSSCKDLSQYRLAFLVNDCNKCCAPEDDDAFIKSDKPKQFPGLEIKYVRGADPSIKLMNDDHEVVEVLGVDKWNTDSLEEFFKERLSS